MRQATARPHAIGPAGTHQFRALRFREETSRDARGRDRHMVQRAPSFFFVVFFSCARELRVVADRSLQQIAGIAVASSRCNVKMELKTSTDRASGWDPHPSH